MFLNQALTQLKNLKSKVTRTEGYIEAAAVHYEDETPEHDYESELVQRQALESQILELKTRIQLTNAATGVTYKGVYMTMSELILRNANLRTEMAFVAKQMAHTTGAESRWGGGRTKDTVKKVLAKGCDKQVFKRRLDELERDKEELESVMATANSSTTLV